MSSRGETLLDVNVLVALFDPDHVHHQLAHDWFGEARTDGWATCAATEIGFVRVVSQPAYQSPVSRPADLVPLLRRFCSRPDHRFWADTPSILDGRLVNPALIQGARQLTDVYLLALTVRKKGRLATFDRSIPVTAVVGATRDTLVVISE